MASVTPSAINVKGGAETITITNSGGQKLAFKLRGTKLSMFDVSPILGFVAAKGTAQVKVTPKKTDAALTPNDHITVCTAPAPDSASDPKQFWAKGPNEPKGPKRYKVKILKDKAPGGNAEEKRASESDSDSDDDGGGGGGPSKKGEKGKPKAASAKPFVFVDDEKTEPPEDLQEVPIFQEFFYRKYD